MRELDVVRFDHGGRLDDPYQPENVRLDSAFELIRFADPGEAFELLQPHLWDEPTLLGNRGKAVPAGDAELGIDASLALIEPDNGVAFCLQPPEQTEGKLKPKAVFSFRRTEYELSLTDYVVAPRLLAKPPGEYDARELGFDSPARTLLTVSLAEPNNDWCTKLVAGVVFLPA
jgi:hypothetical protein